MTEILTYPDFIVTQAEYTNLYITVKTNCCNPYITLNNNDITLISKDYPVLFQFKKRYSESDFNDIK